MARDGTPLPGWNPLEPQRLRWPWSDKWRVVAWCVAVGLIYGALSGILFYSSARSIESHAYGLLVAAAVLLPITGVAGGYAIRPTSPWREIWVVSACGTLAVLAAWLGPLAALNTCNVYGTGSCDAAAGAIGATIVLPVYLTMVLGVSIGKVLGRLRVSRTSETRHRA